MTAVVSMAPAKLIVSGEHSIFFTKKAITCAIDIWINVKIAKTKSQNITIIEKKKKKTFALKDISREHKNDNLIIEIIRTFCNHNKKSICGLKITINNKITISSGLGSSASLIVSMVYGLNELFHTKMSKEDLIDMCIELENICHGKSSGIDIITAICGGVNVFDGKKHNKIAHSIDDVWLIQTGKPHHSTKEVVEYVRKEFTSTALVWQDFEKTTDMIIDCIKQQNMQKQLSTLIYQNEKLLEGIGVVNSNVSNFIKGLLTYNIYAKVCGAGTIGKKDNHNGMIAIFQRLSKPQLQVLKKLCKKYKYKLKRTQIINSGIDVGYCI